MGGLSDHEKEAIQESASEIYTYKCMQSIAYHSLSLKADDDITKDLLTEVYENEINDIENWKTMLENYAGPIKTQSARVLNWRVRIMTAILGLRSFLEWVLIAEDESVESISNLAAAVQDREISEYLVRVVLDERLHINKMKEEILGMESWEMGGGGGVRDVIFGGNDGLVSILALVAGVYGAVTDSKLILITGIAGAIAGTISMGAGAYLSTKSEREVTQKEYQRKGIITGPRDQRKAALLKMYQDQGLSGRESEAVVERVLKDLDEESELTIGEITGFTTEDDWPPPKAGLLTGVSFMVASVIPILPFAILDVTYAAVLAMIGSIAALFGIGVSKAVFTRTSWMRSGIENLIIGTIAATATFIIGKLLPGI